MYWPAIVISSVDDSVQVVYDNGDKEIVDAELVQPQKPPIQFGGEKEQLQASFSISPTCSSVYGMLGPCDPAG